MVDRAKLRKNSVAIIGLGVMGGSLARALSAVGEVEVTGWSPSLKERADALAAKAVTHATTTWEEAVRCVERVVLAIPLEPACALMSELAGEAHPDATITDLISLKGPLGKAAADAALTDRWVGSHPMTGSEASGFEASSSDLYRNAKVWIVSAEAEADHVDWVEKMWRSVGGTPVRVGVDEHDRSVAVASHLPQLVANALAVTLEQNSLEPEHLGPGGGGMVRLAGSNPEMWGDLFGHAPRELTSSLRELAGHLERMADLVEAREITALAEIMESTRRWIARS